MTTPRLGNLEIYKRLLSQARPYWRHIGVYFLINLFALPLALLLPVPLKIVFDSVLADVPLPFFLSFLPDALTGDTSGRLVLAVSLLVMTAVLMQLQGFAMGALYTFAGERMALGFRARLFRHAQRLSLAYHDSRGVSDSVYRIQYDTNAIQHIAIDGVIPFITNGLTLIAMIGVTAWFNLKLAIVALSVAPLLLYASRRYSKKLRYQWTEVKEIDSSALGVVQESLSAVRVVKAFGQEARHQKQLDDRCRSSLRAKMHATVSQGLLTTAIGLTTAVGTAAVLFLGVQDVQAGALTIGGLIVVMSYLAQLYGPLKTLGNKAASVQGSLASAERAFKLLDEAPEVEEAEHAIPLARCRGEVAFEDVSFRYEDGTHAAKGISLDVPAGTKVGIAGHTGAGKTTLMNLLCRFYDPQEGCIRLDGVDTRDYRLADLRDQMGIVLQEPVLFSNSIFENIAYARPSATPEQVEAAAKAAGAHDFIMAMSEQYDTRVGERGMRLSGGERQRISLARAFLKDAPILILDEPTSSVDIKTEAEIMSAMDRLMQGRTSFMIAHRLSTLEHCDIIVELKDGKLVDIRQARSKSASDQAAMTQLQGGGA